MILSKSVLSNSVRKNKMKNIQKIPTKRRPICVIIEKIIIRKRGFAKPLARDGAWLRGPERLMPNRPQEMALMFGRSYYNP